MTPHPTLHSASIATLPLLAPLVPTTSLASIPTGPGCLRDTVPDPLRPVARIPSPPLAPFTQRSSDRRTPPRPQTPTRPPSSGASLFKPSRPKAALCHNSPTHPASKVSPPNSPPHRCLSAAQRESVRYPPSSRPASYVRAYVRRTPDMACINNPDGTSARPTGCASITRLPHANSVHHRPASRKQSAHRSAPSAREAHIPPHLHILATPKGVQPRGRPSPPTSNHSQGGGRFISLPVPRKGCTPTHKTGAARGSVMEE
jgi:hypothetical protein